ncbi:hypothetical protein ABH926_005000 [Catenulispora sp. GP43]
MRALKGGFTHHTEDCMSFVTKTLATTATVAALILAGAGAASADVSSTGATIGTTSGSTSGNSGVGTGNVVQGTGGNVTQGAGNVVGNNDVVGNGEAVVVDVAGWQGGSDDGWHGFWHHCHRGFDY